VVVVATVVLVVELVVVLVVELVVVVVATVVLVVELVVVLVVELVVVVVATVVLVVELVVVVVATVVLVVELVLVLVVELVVVLVVELVVVTTVVLVVELVVVVTLQIPSHAGSVGSPVQVQLASLHCSTIHFLQALNASPVKAPHAELISSPHCLLPQIGGAAPARETKTPAASATVANMTAALLVIRVIVEPPSGRSRVRIRFCARPLRGHAFDHVFDTVVKDFFRLVQRRHIAR
jgi:hypothetical protein